ncbi:uncharacterized protein LOC117177631 isoform X2 [Belonocnema kinseyi]|nr:uncharacterized protein LOC117177631 isoform X2 [Belonocnema kinseyi]
MANDPLKRSNERLSEISERLEQSHLVYLQTEDTPLKLEQRRKLEGFIKEYLCLVQNELKYTFPSTADILHRSAATVQNFSGYRACTAWSAISLYAVNLLSQPWRKEYRTLRTYSGYYKHEVEANLIGAEVMFELMGYKHTGLGVLSLEGPIDPDKVSFVSRDAIVAFVECQILKEIWEGVSKNFTISWLEVLEFRENHVGTPEQAIRALSYRFHEKLRHSESKPNPYLNYTYLPSVPTDVISPSLQYPLPVSNYNTLMCPPEYPYLGGDTGLFLGNYRLDYPENLGNTCGYRTTKHSQVPYHTGMATCTSGVPTGCLIELDPPNHEKSHSIKMNHKNCLDEVDLCPRKIGNNDLYAKVDRKLSTPSSNAENWDYVYAGLKSTGYSKDLGDRDDILYKRQVAVQTPKHRPVKPTEFEEKFQKFEKKRLSRLQNELESATNSKTNHHDLHKKKTPFHAAADFNSRTEFPSEKNQDKSKKINQTMTNLNIFQATDTEEQIAQDMRDWKLSQNDNKQDEGWTCTWCTFLNAPDNSICEMCVKSRYKGNEDVPLASGGKECPQCTLVNEKDVVRCSACDADLKYSPTYI